MGKAKKIALGTLITLLLLGSIGVAFAWGPQGEKTFPQATRSYRKAPWHSPIAELNLSQDQIEKLQQLRLKHQKETLELRNTLQTKRLELQTLLASKDVDEEKVNLILEEMGKLKTELWKKTIHYRLKMRNVLTKEQWDKLLSYRYMQGRGGRGAWFGPLP